MRPITQETIDSMLTSATVELRNLDRRAAAISEVKKAMAGKYVTKRLEPEFGKLPGLEGCRAHISQDSNYIFVHIHPNACNYNDCIDITLCRREERRVDAARLEEELKGISAKRAAIVQSMECFATNAAVLNSVMDYAQTLVASLLPVATTQRSSHLADSLYKIRWL